MQPKWSSNIGQNKSTDLWGSLEHEGSPNELSQYRHFHNQEIWRQRQNPFSKQPTANCSPSGPRTLAKIKVLTCEGPWSTRAHRMSFRRFEIFTLWLCTSRGSALNAPIDDYRCFGHGRMGWDASGTRGSSWLTQLAACKKTPLFSRFFGQYRNL